MIQRSQRKVGQFIAIQYDHVPVVVPAISAFNSKENIAVESAISRVRQAMYGDILKTQSRGLRATDGGVYIMPDGTIRGQIALGD